MPPHPGQLYHSEGFEALGEVPGGRDRGYPVQGWGEQTYL